MHEHAQEPVAIVGMSCRFPGAAGPGELWRLVRAAAASIGDVPAERWDRERLHAADPRTPGRVHTWRGAFLSGIDGCDWRALRLLPREARHMDPQQRLLLELAWEALEDAGLPFEAVAGSRAGVFVGIQWNDFLRLLARDWSRLDGYALLGNSLMMAANRISYAFDLRGPSLAVDCGCASSLTAIQLACQSLWLGEADLALAGAAELILSPDGTIAVEATGMISRSGRCRPLAAGGDGFVRGEGGGVVVLKRLASVTPTDRVYALIRGLAVNHNGHNEWIMAASRQAQMDVLRTAWQRAGIEPADLDYVELHATGNERGDPIEVSALAAALAAGGPRREPCLVGTLKGQLGHAGRASAMAALLKTALALHHGEVPPSPAPDRLNPAISMQSSGLELPASPRPWPRSQRQPHLPIAGVTALSLGGANAHVVLQAAARPPALETGLAPAPALRQPWLLPVSARCPAALAELARRYAAWLTDLEQHDATSASSATSDLCWTACMGRTHHSWRLAVTGASPQELARQLRAAADLMAALPASAGPANIGPEGARQARQAAPARGQGAAEAPLQPPDSIERAAERYRAGEALDWSTLCPSGGRLTTLPAYPWQRVPMWPSWLDVATVSTAPADLRPDDAAAAFSPPTAESAEAVASTPAATPLSPSAAAVPGAVGAVGTAGEVPPLLPAGSLAEMLGRAAPEERAAWLAGYLSEQTARILCRPAGESLDGRPLIELGLDSLTAHEIATRLQADLAVAVPIAEILRAPSLAELARSVERRFRRRDLARSLAGERASVAAASSSVAASAAAAAAASSVAAADLEVWRF